MRPASHNASANSSQRGSRRGSRATAASRSPSVASGPSHSSRSASQESSSIVRCSASLPPSARTRCASHRGRRTGSRTTPRALGREPRACAPRPTRHGCGAGPGRSVRRPCRRPGPNAYPPGTVSMIDGPAARVAAAQWTSAVPWEDSQGGARATPRRSARSAATGTRGSSANARSRSADRLPVIGMRSSPSRTATGPKRHTSTPRG